MAASPQRWSSGRNSVCPELRKRLVLLGDTGIVHPEFIHTYPTGGEKIVPSLFILCQPTTILGAPW